MFHVISLRPLRSFWEEHPGTERALKEWFKRIGSAQWRTPADLKATFRNADPVVVDSGRQVWVFNVKGNHIRLIAAIHFNRRKLFVLRVMTHAEYDLDSWKAEL